MAIVPLPASTIHLIGSAQVLTTPLSLVKELIDNALDAKATSIDILISQNTLDKIEVRDNGHGIPTDDLDSLGRRGHTSKMRSFEELKAVGGVSLGFRGEALASAVQLAEVTVTTRTEGEPVATSVKLNAPGGIDQQTRTSHPVGTTISVTSFFEKIPVRKQTALKQAPKALVKIKELLQAYALARPSIRLSLKITKGNKGSWSFTPRPKDGMREAVSLVIGREAATQCVEKSMAFPEVQGAEGIEEDCDERHELEKPLGTIDGRFLVNAFLPKPNADLSKVDQGQFISVDSRPVSHEKGTMKKIVTIFKFYLKGALSDGFEKLKTPFLRLDIRCPIASYDPNVEPAKDDVIFGNESIVLESLEKLFKDVYGDPKTLRSVPSPHQITTNKLDDFESRLLRKSSQPASEASVSMQGSPPVPEKSPEPSVILLSVKDMRSNENNHVAAAEEIHYGPVDGNRRRWEFDLFKGYTEEVEDAQRLTRPNKIFFPAPSLASDEVAQVNPKNPLNPWVIAKLTAPVHHRSGQDHTPSSSEVKAIQQPCVAHPLTPQHSSDPLLLDSDESPLSTAPSRPKQTFRNEDLQSLQLAVSNSSYRRATVTDSNSAPLQIRRRSLPTDPEEDLIVVAESPQWLSRNDFVVARDVMEAPLTSPPVTQRQKGAQRARDPNRPFVPPLRTTENREIQDGLHQAKLPATFFASRSTQSGKDVQPTQSEASLDLAWAMDFEQRKEEATRRRREEIRASRLAAEQSKMAETFQSSPYKNRYNAAIAALEAGPSSSSKSSGQEKVPFKTSLPDHDPRAYLMRRQKSISGRASTPGGPPELMRAKSTRLPLERIPVEETVHNLLLTIPTDLKDLRGDAAVLTKFDMYVFRGTLSPGLVMKAADTPAVARRLQEAVIRWKQTDAGKIYEVEYNLSNLLNIK